MGGDITAESVYGRGSTFTISLPAVVPSAAPERPLETSAPGPQSEDGAPDDRPIVLVIDDDPTVRELMERFLRSADLRIVTAAGGDEGLRLARELRPAAITLDVLMPAMDGWAVLAVLKADPELAEIPVTMLTIVEDRHLGYALGAADYLTKPVDRQRLVAALARQVGDRQVRGVLLVEDDRATRETVRRALEHAGWTVAEAENGRVALERVADERPGAILLDLMMPEMDGFELIAELRCHAEWREIPVVVMTAKDLTEEDRRRLNGYVRAIVQKAGTSTELFLAELREQLATSVRRPRAMPR